MAGEELLGNVAKLLRGCTAMELLFRVTMPPKL
jgi:hypothetical protein